MAYLLEASRFLIQTLFGLYILAILLRFLLQLVHADFYNPVSQFLVKITSPLLIPLRRLIPGFGGIDIASLVLMLTLQILEFSLIIAMAGKSFHFLSILSLSIGSLLNLLLYIYLVAIIVQAILSWVAPGHYNPATSLLYQLTNPVLRPARRLLPPFSGIDLSPLLVLVVLNLLILLIPHIFF